MCNNKIFTTRFSHNSWVGFIIVNVFSNFRPNIFEDSSTSSVVNTSIGLRSSKNRIINLSFGFGLTEDSPDVLLGLSMPIDFSGLKPGA